MVNNQEDYSDSHHYPYLCSRYPLRTVVHALLTLTLTLTLSVQEVQEV